MAETYRIQVRGHLTDRWSHWFEGLAIERQDDGTTVLTGTIADQAALHGVIARVRDLGLPLVSVSQVDGPVRNIQRPVCGSCDQDQNIEGKGQSR